MSFGRSLMNAATLGLWGWLTDPDITEFFDEVGGTISYNASGDGLAIAKAFFKKFGVVVDKQRPHIGYFKTVKDAHKAMQELVDNYRESYKRRDLVIQIDCPEYTFMRHETGDGYLSFHRDGVTTHCKECGRLLAYGRRAKATNVRCPDHRKASKFVVSQKRALAHKWYHVRAHFYDLDTYEIGDNGLSSEIDDDEEEYED